MSRKHLLILFSVLLLCGCDKNLVPEDYAPGGFEMKEIAKEKVTVTFYTNYNKQEFDSVNGMNASADNLAYKVEQVDQGTLISAPEANPTRKNYEFNGWHNDPVSDSPFDFTKGIVSNTVIYAHWTQTQEDEFVEPEYVEPSKIDDSILTLVDIRGVLNFNIISNEVRLPNSGIYRLTADQTDVVKCLNFKIKTGVTLTASFDVNTSKISYTANLGGETQEGTIKVINNATNLVVNNSTYEEKAKNYEDGGKTILDHKIMLAGSSSMENWKASTVDMLPLATYNHGIGGTTAHQWRDSLNQRLVYPYSPKTVVYYVGVNNIINTGNTVNETTTALREMFDDVHAHLPDTKIYYVLINDLPGFMDKKVMIHAVNNAVIDYERTHDFLTTLNPGTLLLKDDGTPNKVYFLNDGLHMSLAGYALWGQYIKEKLIEDMQ